ncbi:zinc-binding dehydrogenase [Lacticaseibacillus pabuli]|uniref:Zinc-binding dehydrogenase n=1 Tax=Lacticaseibacillus pabuli TaxID=3025672 RepID=A0ABY7WU91_9LACO|nr:zinc-binding dehydrogenase [Lacticaseibacillus sp. KACC 23028]WDF83729.1 zinc-binding dehydrogenase [Lacticaseibacillus sp. KACC 23028]
MKAVVVEKAGGPEVLQLKEVPTPQVKPGWSLVRVKGFGINHSEIYTRKGESPDVKFPRILGIECVGEIADTTDPERLPVGQKVASIMGGMGRDFDGSYAEYTLLPNNQIYPVTTKLSWADFAAIPETFFTAYGSLRNARAQDAKTLLIRAATSGVGVAAIKLAKAMNPGIRVSGSTRNPKKFDLLREAGCDDPIEDRDNQLQTDEKFQAIVELVGPKTVVDSLSHMTQGGFCCVTGGLGDAWTIPNFDPFAIPTGGSLTNFGSGVMNSEKSFNDMLKLIDDNHLDVSPTKTFDLAHTADAEAYSESGAGFGKVVVLP